MSIQPDKNEPNPAFICPITQCEMEEPVIAPDGHSYEKSALEAWFASGHRSSPLTREPWGNFVLIPNRVLKDLIEASHKPSSLVGQLMNIVTPLVKASPSPINLSIKRINGTNKYHISLNCDEKPEANMSTLFIDVIDISGSMGHLSIPEANRSTEGSDFNRLDLVKHSISTQIELIKDNDELAIICFDDKQETILQPTKMDVNGRNQARRSLSKISHRYGTNIWGGLLAALKLAKANKGKNIAIILQTDGESDKSYNPPDGIVNAFREWKEDNADVKFTLHTVGLSYGHTLDMPLLLQLAYAGNGTVNYIPDGSMVGGVFINLMSNLMSCLYSGVFLRMTGPTEPKFFNVGYIQGGQSRDFVLEATGDFSVSLITDNIIDGQTKNVKIDTCEVEDDEFVVSRDNFVKVLQSAYLRKESGVDVTNILNELNTFLSTKTNPKSIALATDFNHPDKYKGQIMKGFETSANYNQWGRHFIPATISAHRFQWSNDFKAESRHIYGGPSIKALIKKGTKIFCELPMPEPSIKSIPKKQPTAVQQNSAQSTSAQSTFVQLYNSGTGSGGCFLPDAMIEMIDGNFVRADQIEKYDKVAGGAQINCVLKIYVYEPIEICYLGKNKKCGITAYHPVKMNGVWVFPCNIVNKELVNTSVVYNFVLESGHIINVDGVEACTLGHNFQGDVIEHHYFGNMIIKDLIKSPGWVDGYVEWKDIVFVRDTNTQIVTGITKIKYESIMPPLKRCNAIAPY